MLGIKSIQTSINEDGRINWELLNDYIEKSGFTEITDLDIIKPGDSIKYTRIYKESGNEKFINSWVVVQVNPDYFLYKGYNGSIWSLQKNEIVRIWYKPLPRKKERTKKIVFSMPAEEGIEVKIDDTVVYRAADNYKKNRFVSTKKYQLALKTRNFTVK
jgi:hypothetical protein